MLSWSSFFWHMSYWVVKLNKPAHVYSFQEKTRKKQGIKKFVATVLWHCFLCLSLVGPPFEHFISNDIHAIFRSHVCPSWRSNIHYEQSDTLCRLHWNILSYECMSYIIKQSLGRGEDNIPFSYLKLLWRLCIASLCGMQEMVLMNK